MEANKQAQEIVDFITEHLELGKKTIEERIRILSQFGDVRKVEDNEVR